ncbi:MAG: branched-chain amino acid ABC transporter permease, partial [Albidovulum sp.]|nr:branched-chain amino acid ABC transporter permease [Albidovulum sp.]
KRSSLPDAPWGLSEFSLDPISSALVAILITAFVAFLSCLVIARLSRIGTTIVTLAILVIVHSIFILRIDIFKGKQTLFGIPQIFDLHTLIAVTVATVIAARMFRESRWGIQLRASSDEEVGARAMSVNVYRLRLLAWVLGSVILAVAGISYAFFLGTISTQPPFFPHVFLTLAMLIFGGMRTVTGAALGTAIIAFGLGGIRTFETGPVVPGIQMPELLGPPGIALGIVMVPTMSLRPGGIMGNSEIEQLIPWMRQMMRRS